MDKKFPKKGPRFRSISETNPVFTVEAELDKDSVALPPTIEIDTNYLQPNVNSDLSETDSGYESCLSSRNASVKYSSPQPSVPSADTLSPRPTGARILQTPSAFSEKFSGSSEISDESEALKSPRGTSSIKKKFGGRRVSYTSENLSELFPGSPDNLRRGLVKRCPTEVCYSPDLCEKFKRGPSLGFRHSFQRERSYSSCSSTSGVDGVNISLHNIIGKKGTGKGQFRNATSVSHVSSGSIIVTDIINCRVTLFHVSGRVVNEISTGPGSEPWSTAVLPNGNFVVSLQKPGTLAIFDAKGEYIKDIAVHLLVKPSGVATDRKGRIVVSDVNTDSIYMLDEEGEVLKTLGQEPDVPMSFEEPRYVEVTCNDKILVCDSGKHCVYVFDSDGNFLHKFGSYGQESGQFRFPYGITSDFEENIYVADHYNNRVSMFSISGEFLCHIVTPCMKLKRPQGLDMRDGIAESVLFVTHGEMKAQEVVAFKIIMGSKNRFKKSIEVYI